MRIVFLLIALGFGLTSYSQNVLAENRAWREKQNAEFRNPKLSPLTDQDRKTFDSIAFFPINESFYVKAFIELTPDSVPFKMKTSTDRLPDYRHWATAHFTLQGKSVALPVYQSLGLMNKPGLQDYLFIPFTDLTNGSSTYGGGRYVEARIPEGDTLIIDFNKAYNPYCAYNERYSCPIPPASSHIELEINAGEKAFEGHSKKKDKESKKGKDKRKKKATE